MAIVKTTDQAKHFEDAIRQAAELLTAGEVVALPTETVYGLAANALNAAAVRKIFAIKGRPAHNPIIVHVGSLEMAQQCVASWSKTANQAALAFWPGPLTLVLPKAPSIPDVVTAGGATVGIRWPNHPVMQAVITRCGFPLAAPSANLSGAISPTTAGHVLTSLGDRIPLILDSGATEVGIESTVLDLSGDPPTILRPGTISAASLAAVVGEVKSGPGHEDRILRSPGLLRKHYAPRAKLQIWDGSGDLHSMMREASVLPERVHVLYHSSRPAVAHLGGLWLMPTQPKAFARSLYRELHRCDDAGAELIIVEAVPPLPEWAGIADRLQRAAAP